MRRFWEPDSFFWFSISRRSQAQAEEELDWMQSEAQRLGVDTEELLRRHRNAQDALAAMQVPFNRPVSPDSSRFFKICQFSAQISSVSDQAGACSKVQGVHSFEAT